ncbi:MAG: hypothetical protein LBF58_07795, partial [Deltaproteobacteria bacterium]|nr:hypothetical protein [Deltaproteobacteria bacterium]
MSSAVMTVMFDVTSLTVSSMLEEVTTTASREPAWGAVVSFWAKAVWPMKANDNINKIAIN